MRHALLAQRVESRLRQIQPGRHGRAAPRLGIRRSDQWTLRSRRWMPKMTRAASGTKKMSKAPCPPLPPVCDAPEFGAGALGGNGGNGRGAFGAAGRCDRPLDPELCWDEWTVDRATARAELELVSAVAVALVRSSTRRNALRLIVERDAWVTTFDLGSCADCSRSCWAAGPAFSGQPAAPASGVGGIGSCATTISTGPAATRVAGSPVDANGEMVSSVAGDSGGDVV